MSPFARKLTTDSFALHSNSNNRTLNLKRIRKDFSLPLTLINDEKARNESNQNEPSVKETGWNFWSPSSILVNSFMKYCSVVTVHTGSKYDLAIDGNGLFAIRKKNKLCFTRKGDFTLDHRGKLITKTGYDVLNHHNNPIFIPNTDDFTITKTGEIFVDQRRINKIKIVSFASLAGLSGKGDLVFAEYLIDIYPKHSTDYFIRQGYLERSSTTVIKEVIESFSIFYSYPENRQL